jgi:hypothetical protein
MKKVIISFVVLVTAICSSNAQVFIGGELGLKFSGGNTKNGSTTIDSPTTFGIRFSPKVGFYLNDKFAIGGEVLLGTSIYNDKAVTNETTDTEVEWGIAPFVRYSVLEFGKFSVLFEGTAGLYGTSSKSKTGNTTVDLPSTLSVGLIVAPLLSYELTEKISLEMELDFLSLGIVSTTQTTKVSGSSDIKRNNTYFGVGADSNNVLNSDLGAVTIGFIYKF